MRLNELVCRVAGGEPPALIERTIGRFRYEAIPPVSPGVNPRPSLNARETALEQLVADPGVAGGEPPALIERWEVALGALKPHSVAGGEPPVLIERVHRSSLVRPSVGCVAGGESPTHIH